MHKIKYGLIGCGRIGKKHLSSALNNGFEITHIYDLIIDKSILLQSEFKLTTTKITSMLGDFLSNEFDFVAIATSSDTHAEISLACIKMGKNVCIEKPIAMGLTEIDNLLAASIGANKKITVCHQNRFNLSVQRLQQSIKKGYFGNLFYGVASIRWTRDDNYYNQAYWRGKWKSDGGALLNQSIHNIDLLLWMMDSPVVEVFAYIDNKNHSDIEVEDIGVALLKFANGAFGIIESSMNTYPENFEETLSIFGEKGTVVLGGKSVNKIVHWNVKDDPIEDLEKFNEEMDSVYGNGHNALYKDFIEAIEQDREPAITLQDGRNAVEVILAIYLSSFEKRPVQFPLPADTSTIMFEGMKF